MLRRPTILYLSTDKELAASLRESVNSVCKHVYFILFDPLNDSPEFSLKQFPEVVLYSSGDILADFSMKTSLNYTLNNSWVDFAKPENILNSPEKYIDIAFSVMLSGYRPKFSICTPAYNTNPEFIYRLYNSLTAQKTQYDLWEWVILDQSVLPGTSDVYKKLASIDSRVKYFVDDDPRSKNWKSNIGDAKRKCFSCARGEFLIELDHDDELLLGALPILLDVVLKFDPDFIYSDCLELDQARKFSYPYPNGWGLHLGSKYKFFVENLSSTSLYGSASKINSEFWVNNTPAMSNLSMRHIVSCPNHVRIWKFSFYSKIGGHNPQLPVVDDYELVVRTMVAGGSCVKVQAPLYVQYYHSSNSQDESRAYIQELVKRVSNMYKQQISAAVFGKAYKADRFFNLTFEQCFNALALDSSLKSSVVDYSITYIPDTSNLSKVLY